MKNKLETNKTRNPKIENITGLNLLPEGTRVFFRDELLFGDGRSRSGKIQAFHVSVKDRKDFEVEYGVLLGQNIHWISDEQIEGFILPL